jgi:16S rRNA G966 N2-methylase RsmD
MLSRLKFGEHMLMLKREQASPEHLKVGTDFTGRALWPCAKALCSYLASDAAQKQLPHIAPEACSKSSAICELGAGTGAPGLLAAKMFHASVVLTDRDEHALEQLKENVCINFDSAEAVEVQQFCWCEPNSNQLIKQKSQFKLILASDVLYPGQSLASVTALFTAVQKLLVKDSGKLLLAYQPRAAWSDPFTTAMLRTAYSSGFRAVRVSPTTQNSSKRCPVILCMSYQAANECQCGDITAAVIRDWCAEWQKLMPDVCFKSAVTAAMETQCNSSSDVNVELHDLWDTHDLADLGFYR